MSDIILDGVTVRFEGKTVLDRFSARLPGGKTTCLLGDSGCGKTTLLRVIAGLCVPDEGAAAGVSGRVSVMFQEDRLLPWFTAGRNVETVCSPAEAARRLRQAGLEDDMDKLPSELSGGMKRRVALARALAFGGDILLLDEPFNGVDAARADKLMTEIRKEWTGRTVVMVTHDEGFAKRHCDGIVYMTKNIAPDVDNAI